MSEDEPKVSRHPGGQGLLPGFLCRRLRPPLSSTRTGKGKEAWGEAVPFVLGVYGASRLFYLLAGILLAGIVAATRNVGVFLVAPLFLGGSRGPERAVGAGSSSYGGRD